MKPTLTLITVLLLALVVLDAADESAALVSPTFPRLMGMNIGRQRYDEKQYQKELAGCPL